MCLCTRRRQLNPHTVTQDTLHRSLLAEEHHREQQLFTSIQVWLRRHGVVSDDATRMVTGGDTGRFATLPVPEV